MKFYFLPPYKQTKKKENKTAVRIFFTWVSVKYFGVEKGP